MGLKKIMGKALHTSALLALLVITGLALNAVLLGWAVFRLAGEDVTPSIAKYADAIEANESPSLPPEMQRELTEKGRWLLLLDGEGEVIYSYAAPARLPDRYSPAQVAQFSRWYLMDYPVRVHVMGDGLLVVGFPIGSVWKYSFETALPNVLFWPIWAAGVLLCNFLLVLIVSALWINRDYKKRDAARCEWIAAVSHDVRTPLATVLGYADALEADSALPPERREQAGLIRDNAQRLRLLIENLNLANRLQYSMEPLQPEWFSPAAAVRESAAAFLNDDANAAYDIAVEVSPAAEQRRLWGERALLLRLLNNLIGNSLRHNKGGCRVSVTLECSRHSLKLTVADDGTGYSDRQLKALAGKSAPLSSGHGLGLTIVRQIALAHRGRIRFSNAPDGGAVCRIVFRRGVR